MNKVLFLTRDCHISNLSKKDVVNAWNSNKYFKVLGTEKYLTRNDIDSLRPKFTRICLQYPLGVLEV